MFGLIKARRFTSPPPLAPAPAANPFHFLQTDGQKTDSKIDPKINAQNEVPEASKDLQGGPPSAPGCSFRPHREPPSSKKHENTKENQCFSRVPKSPPWRLRGLPLPPLEPPWTPKVAQRVPKEPQRLPFGAQIWSKFGPFLVLFSAGSPRPPKCPPEHQNDVKWSPEPQKSIPNIPPTPHTA